MARATYSGSGLVRSDEARRRSNVDTTLIPPRAQYVQHRATQSRETSLEMRDLQVPAHPCNA